MSLSVSKLVLDTSGDPLFRMVRMSGVNQRVLLDDTRNARYAHTFGERHEFDIDRYVVSRCIRFEGKRESVHDLAWPSVFDFQGLIKLERV